MDDTKKMLRTIINNQSVMKGELLDRMDKMEKKFDKRFEEVGKKFGKVDEQFKNVNSRLDKIGKSVAYLEDDAPTRDEFDKLETRVDGLGEKFASV